MGSPAGDVDAAGHLSSRVLHPDYAILRAVPNKALGALRLRMARVSLVLLPWLDRPPVKSIGYKGWISRLALAVFVVFFIDSATSACSRWSRCTGLSLASSRLAVSPTSG